MTYSTIGRPQTSWITFGKADFIRVLLPAARMIAKAGPAVRSPALGSAIASDSPNGCPRLYSNPKPIISYRRAAGPAGRMFGDCRLRAEIAANVGRRLPVNRVQEHSLHPFGAFQ